MKNTLKILLAFTFILFISSKAEAQYKNYLDRPYLETSARADTLVVPDRLYLDIMIRESDSKGRISLEEMENRMVRELRALGIPTESRLSVADLSSNFKDYFFRKDDVQKSKAYTLVLHDALMAGRVIKALEGVDISNIQLQRTEISNLEELKLQMRTKAIERAHAQAKAMAGPLGQNLGPALYISDLNTEYLEERRPVPMMAMEARKDTEAYEPVDLSFNKTKVEARVNIKFALDQ